MKTHARQSGFTLVEIAIVLVIIGLLLGGILKGQEMITQARIKNVTNDFNGTTAAYFSYQDRYKAVPGDDGNAATRWASFQRQEWRRGRLDFGSVYGRPASQPHDHDRSTTPRTSRSTSGGICALPGSSPARPLERAPQPSRTTRSAASSGCRTAGSRSPDWSCARRTFPTRLRARSTRNSMISDRRPAPCALTRRPRRTKTSRARRSPPTMWKTAPPSTSSARPSDESVIGATGPPECGPSFW